MGWLWHQLVHMQIICSLLQTDKHVSTSSLNFYSRMLFLTPSQHCQSSEGILNHLELINISALCTIQERLAIVKTRVDGCVVRARARYY